MENVSNTEAEIKKKALLIKKACTYKPVICKKSVLFQSSFHCIQDIYMEGMATYSKILTRKQCL